MSQTDRQTDRQRHEQPGTQAPRTADTTRGVLAAPHGPPNPTAFDHSRCESPTLTLTLTLAQPLTLTRCESPTASRSACTRSSATRSIGRSSGTTVVRRMPSTCARRSRATPTASRANPNPNPNPP
eukprot:scaffold50982_cov60-Phaeocystis_antarctica.AAC.3